ncbi:MGH1-like glycoside hydrolase domain-containing protein [Anaeromyxobacter oryzae]|uniref:Glucosidase n=1 Tax=Anaeromyxobacter oryzae TaxID=2918170 RepID=A0ABN6MPT4_9BACT|nr:glucosidase [Anaeromyxobacter oryzae]BDG01942.1 glucosidase [Anaeromyxobacter oryzae]
MLTTAGVGAESRRLDEARERAVPWRKWGPYLSERQWGTVREDYSESGDAWNYFSHDQARSRAYHWGEDGLAGLSDDKQRLCFALALWNEKDEILKERLFGLTNSEGNHGEDVKEYYFYLDSTPTHSYMKYLYKYPQRAYPYADLVATNGRRGRQELEYELLDTGVFAEDRYFDVFVEYAKAAPEDVLVRITVANRGPEAARVHLLPTLWFRNTWTWWADPPKPSLRQVGGRGGSTVVAASHATLGDRWLYVEGDVPLLFTENDTNTQRLFGTPNAGPFVKDGFHEHVVHGNPDAVNPAKTGTKAAAHRIVELGPGQTSVLRLRLCDVAPESLDAPFAKFEEAFAERLREADAFYRAITPPKATEDEARVLRQALAGMLWSKQYYFFDAEKWLREHKVDPFQSQGGSVSNVRNQEWRHMVNDHVISMPDKWEYPWYAAWDLAFHAIALSAVDVDFAKGQLDVMLREFYLHPSGQIPAYEWNFSDVNPPVHAWATLFIYRMEQRLRGQGDLEFMKRSFGKLLSNFNWWVNRKDRFGKNVFEGGFLGLDNIGVFDRSAPLPTGGHLEQADGTAWMSLFCQTMLDIGTEIAATDPAFDDLSVKFVEHFLWIANAMNRSGAEGMWDEEDGFYYDILRLPDGTATRLKVRSMVGLLPLCATTVFERFELERTPRLVAHFQERVRRFPHLLETMHAPAKARLGAGEEQYAYADRAMLAVVTSQRLRRILARMLDENEFLSPYGLRAVSRYHKDHPYVFHVAGQEFRVDYLPAESDSGMFGGNSNWRGPIWMPVNVLLIRALLNFYLFYGDAFRVECPTGSGRMMNLYEVAEELAKRLTRIFLRGADGKRPVYGGTEKFQTDPHWRDNLLFYEYFHGDLGAGIGASHQTGWTGLVATLIRIFGTMDAKSFLELGNKDAARREVSGQAAGKGKGKGGAAPPPGAADR